MRVNWEGVKSLIGLAALVCFVWTIASAQKGPDFGNDPPEPSARHLELIEKTKLAQRARLACPASVEMFHQVGPDGLDWFTCIDPDLEAMRGNVYNPSYSLSQSGEFCDDLDSDSCESEGDRACKSAGYCGANEDEVEIIVEPELQSCMVQCTCGCNANGCPTYLRFCP